MISELIRRAIASGVASSFLAQLLILPFLASLIAAARHLFGLTTYGTFIPVVLSLIWLKLGLITGSFLSLFLYFWAHLVRRLIQKTMIKRFRIDYLPRMAIFLLFITLGLFLLILVDYFPKALLEGENLFVLLILLLIVKNLIENQITLSGKEAQFLVLETAFFGLAGYGLLSWPWLKSFVLAYPGWSIVLTFLFNIVIGRYVGFRLLEYRRFRPIIKAKK